MVKKHVLIVDDDPDIVEAMRLILEAHEYEVTSAGNTADGLDAVLKTKPDVIILDVMMETDTDGFHFAYTLRNAEPDSPYDPFKNVPILMLTAISQRTGMQFNPSEDEEFLPVDDFVEKPIKPEELINKIQKLTT